MWVSRVWLSMKRESYANHWNILNVPIFWNTVQRKYKTKGFYFSSLLEIRVVFFLRWKYDTRVLCGHRLVWSVVSDLESTIFSSHLYVPVWVFPVILTFRLSLNDDLLIRPLRLIPHGRTLGGLQWIHSIYLFITIFRGTYCTIQIMVCYFTKRYLILRHPGLVLILWFDGFV